MPVLVQRLLVAIHEIPKNVSMVNVDDDQHLVLCVESTNECEAAGTVAVGNLPNLKWVSHRI